MLLNNTATACQPPSILTLFLDGEVSPALRVTPAIDTVKAVFKHLEDPEAGREFFATTFENLQVCPALTCPVCHGHRRPGWMSNVQPTTFEVLQLCSALTRYEQSVCLSR